jgi:hypothetical protein
MASIAPPSEKFSELILYVALKTDRNPWFGATKLNKVLFFADFEMYRQHGASITGAKYVKKPKGPVPFGIEPLKAEMCRKGDAAERREMAGSYLQRRFIPLRPPRLELFTGEEISLVDQFIDEVSGETADQVSERTHRLDGWKLAEMGEEIPLFTVLLPDDEVELTDEELDRGRRLAARLSAPKP